MKKGMRIIQGLLLAYIITGIMLIGLSCLLYQLELGERVSQIGIILTYIISTWFGGFYIGRKVKSKRLLYAMVFGVLYIGCILGASKIIYPNGAIFSGNMLTIAGMCLGGSALGGILS